MKYEVTFSCGHTGTVQLYGKGDERERKIRYFEEYGVCSECYKERRDAGAYESDMSIQVNDLHEQGYSVENIAKKLRVSKSTVSAYLPYTKGVYLGENPSNNALKIRKCRAKNG